MTQSSNNADELAIKLEGILKVANQYVPPVSRGLLQALNIDGEELRARASIHLHELGREIEQLIVADPRFLGKATRMIASLNGASGFYPSFLTSQLLVRLLETQSAASAINWLEKVLKTESADGNYVTVLWNVQVAEEIQITSDIKLVPFSAVPMSGQKDCLAKERFNRGAVPTPLDWQDPTAALIAPYKVSPFLVDPSTQEASHDDYLKIRTTINDVIEALTLVGPRVPVIASSWFNFNDPDLEAASLGVGQMRTGIEILPHWSAVQPVALDPVLAISTVAAYQALPPNTKAWVQIATMRLRQALSRHDPSDRAVELSIALETLMGDNGNSEMTHKVCVRAVRLLGGPSDVRKRNFTVLKKTYDIRSKRVHQGKRAPDVIGVRDEKLTTDQFMSVAADLCAELIRLVISRGGAPDWQVFDINN